MERVDGIGCMFLWVLLCKEFMVKVWEGMYLCWL